MAIYKGSAHAEAAIIADSTAEIEALDGTLYEPGQVALAVTADGVTAYMLNASHEWKAV